MEKKLNEYDRIIFFGGGCMAERLYNQIEGISDKLIGVMDMVPSDKRKINSFHGLTIQNPEAFREDINNGAAVVVAIGNINVCNCVRDYIDTYGYTIDNLYVVNPYSTLRFFMVNDELAKDIRIPFTDDRYDKVKNIFHDNASLEIYNMLENSKPYESINDSYELLKYSDIKELYYYKEDYWTSMEFSQTNNSEATIFDCGAYIGDSLEDICNSIPEKDVYYYAFEPVKSNLDKIEGNTLFNKICKEIIPVECGVGEKDDELYFGIENESNFDGGRFVDKDSIGNYSDVWKLSIKSIDGMNLKIRGKLYIKMDIEGSELGALKGAVETIKKHHPYLAICLYHKKNDLLEIPTFLSGLGMNYDYYLRGGYHTILWAIPKE